MRVYTVERARRLGRIRAIERAAPGRAEGIAAAELVAVVAPRRMSAVVARK
jgi:hypothetical protein